MARQKSKNPDIENSSAEVSSDSNTAAVFRLLFESSPHPYLVLLPDKPKFTIFAVNDSYLQATGTQREAILGRGLFEVFPDNPDDASATGVSDLRVSLERVIQDHVQDVMGVQKYDIPRRGPGETGFEVKYWSPVNTPVFDEDGSVAYIIHRVEDVTEFILLRERSSEESARIEKVQAQAHQMEAEVLQRAQELKEANRQIKAANEELERRERELGQLYARLQELDRVKTAFFSNVSHELRTPLTLMLGPVEEILYDPGTIPRNRERMKVAHRNALRLQKLVNNLLDFSRIEAGRMQISYLPTDLSALTAELASMFRSAVEKAGLKLIVDCPPLPEPIYVDRDMWEKVVLNLLSNAFKHTFQGEIEVRLRQIDGFVELAVRDTGVGIPEEQIPYLFERFHRVPHAKSRTHEGSGIGLALVAELVKLHGGTVDVASEVGQGSTFKVSVPVGSAHLQSGPFETAVVPASTALRAKPYVDEALEWLPSEEEMYGDSGSPLSEEGEAWYKGDGQRVRVLLADDNADMRSYVRRLLEPYCEVETVADGIAAVEAARRNRPDLILTDIMMPNMDGFQLLSTIRNDPSLKNVPVILLSARAGEEARVEGLHAGADDYLTKPFNTRELLARVKANLNLDLQRARMEAEEAKLLSEQRFSGIFNQATVGIAQTDLTGQFVLANDLYCEMVGRSKEELYQLRMQDITHPDDLPENMALFDEMVREGTSFQIEKRYVCPDGSLIWVNNNVSLIRDIHGKPKFVVAVSQEITDRKRVEAILEGQKQALEQAVNGMPLAKVLETIARIAEEQSDTQLIASILLLDEDGRHLRHGAAPSLPDAYNQAIDGIEIGPDVGSCGTAAFTGKEVIVQDIENNPLWAGFKDLALAYGLRACWSTPIFSSKGGILGTFALYYPAVQVPSTGDREVIELLSRTAGLIIEWHGDIEERQRAEAALKESEERFRVMADNIPNLAWMADADGWISWYNKRWYEYTGTTPEQMEGWGWQSVHDPETLPQVMERWKKSIDTGEPFEMVFPLKGADGVFRPFLTRVMPIRNEENQIVRWFGTNTDVTEAIQSKRELEEHNKLMNMVSEAQTLFFSNKDIYDMFEEPLQKLLDYTSSAYGFIGEILQDENGKPYLKCCFITNISWNEATRKLWEENRKTGFEFHKLDNLFGEVITTGEVVISNDPDHDPRRAPAGRPPGHPPLKAFLGIPFFKNGQLVGMVGIANRPNGYDMALVERLRPFTDACANIIEAYRSKQELHRLTEELTRKQEVLQRTFERERLVRRIVELTNQTFDVDSLLNIVAREIGQFFQVDRAYVIRYEQEGQYLNLTMAGDYYRADDVPRMSMEDFPPEVLKTLTRDLPIKENMQNQRFNTAEAYRLSLHERLRALPYMADLPPEKVQEYIDYYDQILFGKLKVSAVLRAGITYRDKPFGIIMLQQCEDREWTDEEVSLLKDIATQVGVAFYQTDLYQQEQQAKEEAKIRAKQQEAVSELGLKALSGIELQELMDTAAEVVAKTLEVDYCKILEMLPGEKEMLLRAGFGWKKGLVGTATEDTGLGSPAGYVLLKNEPVIVEDLRTETRFKATPLLLNHDVKSGISVVIYLFGKPWGAMGAYATQARKFSRQDVNFFQSVANVIATAIERKQIEQEAAIARTIAEAANRKKSEFLAMMSHELRTPLNSIIGYSQMIDMVGPVTDKQAQYIKNVNTSGQHLLTIINDLLDVSKIEAGKLEIAIEYFELAPLAEEVKAMIQEQAAQKPVDLTFEIEPQLEGIYGDRARVKQILINLLSNAIKFNRPSGTVEVIISKSDDGEWIKIAVKDTGIGIPNAKLPELFQKFYQVDNSASRKHEGTGLGLALTKELVELHRGRIDVESEEGIGTTFTVWMPATPPLLATGVVNDGK